MIGGSGVIEMDRGRGKVSKHVIIIILIIVNKIGLNEKSTR